jgi:thiamine biosynthesis protein ThiS
MTLQLNGNLREFEALQPGSNLQQVIDALQLKGDRIAVEHNGSIIARAQWAAIALAENDKLEVVHFVGGG